MRLCRAAVFVVIVASAMMDAAQTRPKKHSDISAAFSQARFVYVEAMSGDIMKPSLYPEDRQAISDVQDGVRDWNRYAIATSRRDADLVFIVRKGRALGEQDRIGISGGQPRTNPSAPNRQPGQLPEDGSGIGVGTEVGPSDDILRVYTTNPDGKLVGPIWTREMRDGLDAPSVALLRQLENAVEQAYPNQPAPKHP
ncbi:MAG TPA: hypothetical protein VHZ28_09965 [Terracidiphilus sp.]|nr:hypothetical protein [Terracidiphilus sp.]